MPIFVPSERSLTDYGGLHRSTGCYLRFAPANVAALWAGLAEAASRGLVIRVRGAGHSMNGSSIPRPGELLVEAGGLDGYEFARPGTITAGAGAAMWDVQRLLAPRGLELLVHDDSEGRGKGGGSTVGGYVSAGSGGGAESWRHGGFWESVESIDIVTLNGAVRRIDRSDPLFPWLFGSMGQLGIIVAATLVVRARAGADPVFPLGEKGRVPQGHHGGERTVWFSTFVPLPARDRAGCELAAIGDRHSHAWQARPAYVHELPFGRFNPPLIHPAQQDLAAVGIWGEAPEGGFDYAALQALDEEFTAWLSANPDYRRHAQTELLQDGFDFAAHFGAECFAGFRDWKRKLDPAGRLAPGLFDQSSRRASA